MIPRSYGGIKLSNYFMIAEKLSYSFIDLLLLTESISIKLIDYNNIISIFSWYSL